ncbi:hypothetical protein [Rhodovulum sulfidophilum]|uniref:hypothetical protein n=1 Tax=Rhodovulum sulfidophilum TaxID=35806 RepID=UPI00192EB363|nr:hypothetical protein [Rhodovulum sulfidophilum]
MQGGTWTVILSVAALLVPVFQVAVAEGFCAVDPQIDEMTRPFRVLLRRRLHYVIWSVLWTALGPALRIGGANRLHVILLTKLLSGADGLGDAVQTAQTYFQTERLFALVLAILALVRAMDAVLGRLQGKGSHRRVLFDGEALKLGHAAPILSKLSLSIRRRDCLYLTGRAVRARPACCA